jgi:hypothetical protein
MTIFKDIACVVVDDGANEVDGVCVTETLSRDGYLQY